MKKILTVMIVAGIIFYVLVFTSLLIFQRHLIYQPMDYISALQSTQDKFNMSEYVTNSGLRVWASPASSERTDHMVFLYGSADSMFNQIEIARIYHELGYGVLLCSYPGYDGNQGKPTAISIYEAAEACIDFLNRSGISDQNIVLHSHFLGGHLAIKIAQYRIFKALVLLAPLGSIVEIAKNRYPIFPVEYMLIDRFISYDLLDNVKSPTLVIHNKHDTRVPFSQGEKIYNLLNTQKQLVVLDVRTYSYHTLYTSRIAPTIIKWLDDIDNEVDLLTY